MSVSIISRSRAPRARCPAARASASGSPRRSARASPACSTCWTSPRSGCTSATMRGCSKRCRRLRDLGNTVIVVEHDEDAIRTADHVLDIGPGAGIHGGHIVAQGTVDDLIATPASLTGKYLSGELIVPVPERRPRNARRTLSVVNARGNNLKNVTAEIPLGLFTCVTGVSGGGKSTLLVDTLYKAIARKLNGASEAPCPARPHRGPRASRQGDRHRPVADRPHPAQQSRRPIPARSRPSANGSPACPRPRRAATSPAASRSTSRAGAARPARATA